MYLPSGFDYVICNMYISYGLIEPPNCFTSSTLCTNVHRCWDSNQPMDFPIHIVHVVGGFVKYVRLHPDLSFIRGRQFIGFISRYEICILEAFLGVEQKGAEGQEQTKLMGCIFFLKLALFRNLVF